MNNSVFGKTMEGVRKRVNIDLVKQVGEERRLRRLISDPAFVSRKIFYGSNLVAVHRRQTNVKLNKPEYVEHVFSIFLNTLCMKSGMGISKKNMEIE